jgi:PAS domain S-box-containing protein
MLQDAIWDRSLIGLAQIDTSGRFLKANPVFCQLLGYSEAELQDKTWMSITHPDDLENGQEMFNRVLNKQVDSYRVEKRYLTKRGFIIWIDAAVDSINDGTDVKFILKQVIGSKILIPDTIQEPTEPKKVNFKSTIADNYKVILAAIVGTVFTIYGAYTHNSDIQNIGLGISLGIFGGVMAKK